MWCRSSGQVEASISLRFIVRNSIAQSLDFSFVVDYRAASMLPVNSATRALIRATRDSMAINSVSTHSIINVRGKTYSLHRWYRHRQLGWSGCESPPVTQPLLAQLHSCGFVPTDPGMDLS